MKKYQYTPSKMLLKSILTGRATQIHLPMKPQPHRGVCDGVEQWLWANYQTSNIKEEFFPEFSPYQVGDRLWVRERITLEVKAVRACRIQAVNAADALKAGVYYAEEFDGYVTDDFRSNYNYSTPLRSFERFWAGHFTYKKWNENIWVWQIDFKIVTL